MGDELEYEEDQAVTLLSSRINLNKLSPLTEMASIYKVPKKLRDWNEKAYAPRVVSIGPYTHGMKAFEFMEKVKLKFLEMLLSSTGKSIEELVMFVRAREAKIRACYASEIPLKSGKFVDIIVVDAAFVLMILISRNNGTVQSLLLPFLENGYSTYDDIIRDMGVLLENQLPLFLLEELLVFFRSSGHLDTSTSIVQMAFEALKYRMLNEGITQPSTDEASQLCHFVDLFRVCHLPSKLRRPGASPVLRIRSLSLTELQNAGVKFELSSSNKKWADIQFNDGVLEMPYMKIDDSTETVIRNIVAFEQYHDLDGECMTDYIVAMSQLVRTPKDVEILNQNKILLNGIGHDEQVSDLFYYLDKDVSYDPSDFYYARLFEDLDSHCKISWNIWYASLKQEYFENPWKIISIIAAGILLLLTLTQTIASVMAIP